MINLNFKNSRTILFGYEIAFLIVSRVRTRNEIEHRSIFGRFSTLPPGRLNWKIRLLTKLSSKNLGWI